MFLVYKASAGSGKTFTLAVHYIKLLVMADGPDEYSKVLAVTFTNKATAEMKDRILSQLYGISYSLASSQKYLSALRKSIAEDGDAVPPDDELRRRCRVALHHILHDYNRFRVQTIDSFFQTVLRGLAHELGLSANLQVEISDTEVLSKAVDRLVDRLQDDPPLLDWMMSLVRDQIENNQRWDITRSVKAFGRAIFDEDYITRGDKLRRVIGDEAAFRSFISRLTAVRSSAPGAVASLGTTLEARISALGVTYSDFAYGSNLQTFVDKLVAADMTLEPSKRVRDWAFDPMKLLTKANQTMRPDLVAAADELSGYLSETLDEFDRLQRDYNSAQLVLAHIKQLRLLANIDEEVTQLNVETGRFNLAKTPILLNRMVGESDSPFVFEKIGTLLRHVIIDEFQDTSHLQWQNFKVLLKEALSKGGHSLIVGDVKQSIYRFRGGDWRMLGNIEREISPAPRVRTLDMNYRSLGRVIDFNNDFFQEAAATMDTVSAEEQAVATDTFRFADAYADVYQYKPDDTPQEGYVRVVSIDSKSLSADDDCQRAIIDDLMEQVRQLHADGAPYSRMTILVRNNFEAQPIIDAFASADDMPEIVSDEAFLFSSSEAIQTIVCALRLLVDATDVVPAFFLLQRYPDKALFTPEQSAQLLRLPLYELVETLCRHFELSRQHGQEAYLAAFFDAVQDFVHGEQADIPSLLRYWDERLGRQSIPAAAVDGIRILTIHKSKGMEFDTVFLPFCTWKFYNESHRNLIWCVPTEAPYSELGLLPITSGKNAAKSAFASDYAREHLYARLDELNSLYVAFTRARNNIYVWAVGNAKGIAQPSRSVGDLVVSVYPHGYEDGIPVCGNTPSEASQETKPRAEENRLQAVRRSYEVPFATYALHAQFRQSNRSQQFIASALADDVAAAGELSRQQQYIELGNLLHSVLQQMRTREDMPRVLDALEHEGIITRTASDGSYVSVRRSDVAQWLERGFANAVVADWFSGRWTLFNECAILSVDAATGGYDSHRPDRVMVSPDGRRVVVVDFKFGSEREEYCEQVLNYMRLLSGIYPEAQVEGYLWYVYKGVIRNVK